MLKNPRLARIQFVALAAAILAITAIGGASLARVEASYQIAARV